MDLGQREVLGRHERRVLRLPILGEPRLQQRFGVAVATLIDRRVGQAHVRQ